MRVWEFEDKKETPSNLVREQDFILRVRRMQRTGQPCLALNFILTAIEALAADAEAMEAVQKKLQAFASSTSGAYYEMSNGDVFLVWENPGEARLMANRATDAALEEHKNNTNVFLLIYRIPEAYGLLRERANVYVEEVRKRQAALASSAISGAPLESSSRLTARNVDQIEHLLADADVRRYGRSQTIRRDDKGAWTPVAEEYFISFEELRREHFPKLDMGGAEHFFQAICALLDKKLLGALTSGYQTIAGRTINLNLSIASIMDVPFAQFVRGVPRDQRRNIGFELHCADLFQDFSLTLGAIEALRSEGFRVIIDGVAPNMVSYTRFDKFSVDQIKINASKERMPQFHDPLIRKAIEGLPPEKVIFFRCDTEQALAVGREMGISVFQGWLIDDLASGK